MVKKGQNCVQVVIEYPQRSSNLIDGALGFHCECNAGSNSVHSKDFEDFVNERADISALFPYTP